MVIHENLKFYFSLLCPFRQSRARIIIREDYPVKSTNFDN